MLSHTVEYALRATLYIARQQSRPVRLLEVATAVHAPPNYLAKVLGQLTRAGVLESARGPRGGFRLSPRKERLSLSDVAAVFEAAEQRRCLLGRDLCGANPSCAVHDRWAPIATEISHFFARTTIAALLFPRTST